MANRKATDKMIQIAACISAFNPLLNSDGKTQKPSEVFNPITKISNLERIKVFERSKNG